MSRKFNFFVKQNCKVAILCSLCALFFMISGCGKSDNKACEDVVCTDVYISIPLKLKYPDDQPVLLDSSKVFWVSENRYLEQNLISWNEARAWGSYIIVSDGMRKELQGKEEIMRFTGYMNGNIVCERDVLVGANCCHVAYYGTEPLSQVIQY